MKKILSVIVIFIFCIHTGMAIDKVFSVEVGWGGPVLKEYDSNVYYEEYWKPISFNENFPVNNKKTTGALFARGYLTVSKRIDLGIGVSYERYWQNFKMTHYDKTYLSVMPILRYNWRKGSMVHLYSSVALGYYTTRHNGDRPVYEEFDENGFAGQITLLGMSIGKRIYWFGELGGGAFGYFNTGIGFRFNNKK